jgi:hypothetical protein
MEEIALRGRLGETSHPEALDARAPFLSTPGSGSQHLGALQTFFVLQLSNNDGPLPPRMPSILLECYVVQTRVGGEVGWDFHFECR